MQDSDDTHVSVSFSLSKSVKEEMDRRAKSLRISRSDFLKFLILWDLDNGPDAPFTAGVRKPRPPQPPTKRKKHE